MTAHRSTVRRAAALAATVTATLLLAACGTDGESSGAHGDHGGRSAEPSATATQQKHNAADVTFAQGMIPHHRQAVTMSELAEDRATSEKVKELARKIEEAQAPEIEKLSGWLTAWGEQVPPIDGRHAGHAGHDMAGMMTSQQMSELRKSSGKEFDEAFLAMMVEHHEGAVEMARTEKSEGSYPPAKGMAEAIIASQSAEIDTMKRLLGGD